MAYRDIVLADSPVVYYEFNESGAAVTAVDSSTSANNGTYTASPTLGQPPLILTGTSMVLTGANYVISGGNVGTTGAETAEAWIKTTASVVNMQVMSADSATRNFQMRINSVSGVLEFVWLNNIPTAFTWSGTTRLNDGLKHHVVCTLTAGLVLQGYVDGLTDGASVPGSGAHSLSSQLEIGARGGGLNFVGTIDEAAYYNNVALSPGQVAAHYLAGTQASSVGLQQLRPIAIGGFS